MNKNELLKLICVAGYDVGFGAKTHFATLDLIEKAPGWIGFISLVGGLYGLFVPIMASTHVAAVFIIFGVVSLYIAMYGTEKQRYEDAGKALTKCYHELHTLHSTVKSLPDQYNFSAHVQELQRIRGEAMSVGLSKQIFLSDWYAHYKFFWQHQIDWVAEHRPFSFFRDKIPLSAYAALVVALIAGLGFKFCG